MKSLKEFLSEDVTQVHGHNSVIGNILSRTVLIPISDSTLNAIAFNPPEVVGYHVFTPTTIDRLMSLEGSKKSISTFLNFPGQFDVETGIEGGGGAVAIVRGKPVLSAHTDAYTVVDSNGRRWVEVGFLVNQLAKGTVISLLKSQVQRGWIKEFDLAKFKESKDFITKKSSEALHTACEKAGIFRMAGVLSDDWWARNGMRVPFEDFQRKGHTLQRSAVTTTIHAIVDKSQDIVTNKQRQVFIKTYMDEINKIMSRYKRQMRILLFPVMYSTSMMPTMHRVDETVVHSIKIEGVTMIMDENNKDRDRPKEKIKALEKHSNKYSLNIFYYESYRSEEGYEKMKRHAQSLARSIRGQG